MSLRERIIFYLVIDEAGEAPIMSSKPDLHVEFCVVTRKVVTPLRINLPDVQKLTLEVKPSLDHSPLSLASGHQITVFVVITGHQLHTLHRLGPLLPPDFALEHLVSDEEGGEAPHEEAGAEHHPPPAGHHHGHSVSGVSTSQSSTKLNSTRLNSTQHESPPHLVSV